MLSYHYVDIYFLLPDSLAVDREFDLIDALAAYKAVASIENDRRSGAISMCVGKMTMSDATTALETITTEMRTVLGDIKVTRFTIVDEATRTSENDAPTFPELILLVDIAKQLGVTRQRAHQLAAKETFPKPIITTSAGPLFAKLAVEHWIDNWARNNRRRQK